MKYGFIDIPTVYFFEEKNIFTGSCLENFSFRIYNRKKEDDTPELCCAVWEGKLTFADVPPEEYALELHEPLTQAGVDSIGSRLLEAAKAYAANGYRF